MPRAARSDLPHADDVPVRVLEECATDATLQRYDTFNLHAVLSQLGDLSLDVRDLERGHSSIDGRHRPLENRQSCAAAAAVANRFRNLRLDLKAKLFLIEAPSPRQVV